ncbi:hypothetical protein [Streptococcus porcinus]
MKKLSLVAVSTLLLFSLTACTTSNSKEIKKIEKVSTSSSEKEQQKTPVLTVGDSHTFDDSFNGGTEKGLKITVNKIAIDKNIQLNTEYSNQDYTGMIPVIAEATFENTSNRTIDLTAFSIIDSKGDVGKWVPYLEGVTTQSVDVLTAGQKVNQTFVFAIKNEGGVDLTYNDATWKTK